MTGSWVRVFAANEQMDQMLIESAGLAHQMEFPVGPEVGSGMWNWEKIWRERAD